MKNAANEEDDRGSPLRESSQVVSTGSAPYKAVADLTCKDPSLLRGHHFPPRDSAEAMEGKP